MKVKGFTLIEIIISISLILMIASFAIYQNTFSYSMKKQQIETFVSDIRYIKQLGLQGDKKAKIIMNYEENFYTIVSDVDDRKVYFHNNVKLSSFTLNEISFYKDSWTKGNTIHINFYIGSKKYSYVVKISSITGRIKLEEE